MTLALIIPVTFPVVSKSSTVYLRKDLLVKANAEGKKDIVLEYAAD
jgi:hypothetical protein